MATTQAARRNLRMQKEMKLLISDPPLFASFPSLSSAASSLSSIDAELRGPEGTPYECGVFHVRILIPDRYPLQPPGVTFVTPIYHPNIDNGGRVCLDILNLPPKGAWQPSLNISAVLISVHFLLAEPNPDDGLMCEASREYKYNRQLFDHKARTMTEKYARPGSVGSCGTSSSSIDEGANPNMQMDSNSIYEDVTRSVGHQEPCTSFSKLVQDSSGSGGERAGKGQVNEARKIKIMDVAGSVKSMDVVSDHDWNLRQGSQSVSKRKLSLSCSDQLQEQDHTKSTVNVLPVSSLLVDVDDHNGKVSHDKSPQEANERMSCRITNYQEPKYLVSGHRRDNCNEMTCKVQKLSSHSNQCAIGSGEHDSDINLIEKEDSLSANMKPERFSASRKLSLGFSGSSCRHTADEKENIMSVQGSKLLSRRVESSSMVSRKLKAPPGLDEGPGNGNSNSKLESCGADKKPRRESTGESHHSNGDKCPPSLESWRKNCDEPDQDVMYSDESTGYEAVIVLDSEASDDEASYHKKFDRSLAKKRLFGK